MLAHFLPRILTLLLHILMLAFVARRIWLYARGDHVPLSYAGLPQFLVYVGTVSFIIAAIVLVPAILSTAGSGVPAGLALLPALFCIPWAFFLTELFSFRKRTT